MPDFAVRTAFTATDKISPAFKRMGDNAEMFASRTSSAFSSVRSVTMGILAASGIGGIFGLIKTGISSIVGEASRMENAIADFTTLTGSVENAEKAVADLKALGAATPFEFGDLAEVTKTMLGFGAVTKDTIIPTLQMLGDTAGGNAERLKSIALAYSQVQAAGKMMGQDLNQMINAGVPILAQLAKQWGVTVGAAKEMVSQGRATGAEVTKAFQQMTSAGGMFHKGMERASLTLSGRFSTFQDNVKGVAASLGNQLMPTLKTTLDKFIEWADYAGKWVDANKDTIKEVFEGFVTVLGKIASWLPELVGGFLAYKAALIGIVLWQKAAIAVGWVQYLVSMLPVMAASIKAQGLMNFLFGGSVIAQKAAALWTSILAVKTGIATGAMWLFNAAMSANPIGAVIVAITALIAGIVALIYYWDELNNRFKEKTEPFKNASIESQQLAEAQAMMGFTPTQASTAVDTNKGMEAPNLTEIQARQINLQGEINISGAPQGTTVRSVTKGAQPIQMNLVGQNT